MSFSNALFVLENHEEKVARLLLESIQENRLDIIRSIILNPEYSSTILKLGIINKTINTFLADKEFEPYWQNLWRLCGVNPKEAALENNQAIHENLPLITVSCYQLVKTHFCYEAYRKLTDNGINESSPRGGMLIAILNAAALEGSFFASNAFCTNGLRLFLENHEKVSGLRELIISLAKNAAKIHFTPGYYLLANVYAAVANAESNEVIAKEFRKKAYTALCLAQKLQPYSTASLNNAYQGLTLEQASNGKFKSWFHAKVLLKLTATEERLAKSQADIEFNLLKKEYLLNEIEPIYEPQLSSTFPIPS